jgi:CRP-like cAMP-binding protein
MDGSCFFILKTGLLEMSEDGRFKKLIKPQIGFGEAALLYNSKRSHSVRAK